MKYRTAKELPNARIGSPVIVMPSKLCYPNFTYETSPDFDGIKVWIMNIKELVYSGWIEEAKPREWIIDRQTLDNLTLRYDKEMFTNNIEYVKVREVLE